MTEHELQQLLEDALNQLAERGRLTEDNQLWMDGQFYSGAQEDPYDCVVANYLRDRIAAKYQGNKNDILIHVDPGDSHVWATIDVEPGFVHTAMPAEKVPQRAMGLATDFDKWIDPEDKEDDE